MRCASVALFFISLSTTALTMPAEGALLNHTGTFGAADLSFPGIGASVDSAGNLYVPDFNSKTVKVFDASHVLVNSLGGGTLLSPASVVAAPNGMVYVGDVSRIVPMTTAGVAGTPFGTLNSPFGIAADAASNIFVADTGNNRILSFSPTGTPGLTLTSANGINFKNPVGVAVDSQHIYVADSFNNRIVTLDTAGNFLSSFSTVIPNWSDVHPKELAIAPDGTIFCSLGDPGFAAFSSSGQLLDTYGGLDRANGVALFGNTLYGVETGAHLVHLFQVPEPASLSLLAPGLLILSRRRRR